MLLPQSSAFAALKNRLNSVSSISFLHTAPRPYVSSSTPTSTPTPGPYSPIAFHSIIPSTSVASIRQDRMAEVAAANESPSSPKRVRDTYHDSFRAASTPGTSGYDRPNRLGKGREDVIIRWDQLLEKFRSVQERARRAQRQSGGRIFDDGSDFGELRINDSVGSKETARPSVATAPPPVPQKDATTTAPPPKRTGLGRQFGRLGATVAGRGKRPQ